MGGSKSKLYKNYSAIFNASPTARTSGAHAHSGRIRKIVETVKTGNCFAGYPRNILPDQQGKHVPGHRNYKEGRSYITIPLERLQMLANKFSGTGYAIKGTCKERINFHEPIGVRVENGRETLTEWGIIHHSRKGLHIVPSRPWEKNK